MRLTPFLCLLCLGCGLAASGQTAGRAREASAAVPASTCTTLPTINPAKGFTGNFNNSCYALPLVGSSGSSHGGDSNANYSQAFYQVTPGYDLVVLGTFPNARFMSATVYDSHETPIGAIMDYQLLPLGNTMINPFRQGATYKPNQMYGFTISFGGTLTNAPSPGCSAATSTINQTVIDATQIHPGMSWNGYPGLPAGFPPHTTGANIGGLVMIRKYIGISKEPAPVILVRQLSTGCAVPLTQAQNIVSTTQVLGTTTWLDENQCNDHHQFVNTVVPTECYPFDPNNQATWVRSPDWVGRNNTAAGYVSAVLSTSAIQSLLAGQTFLRVQFPLPSVPPTPCADGQCSRSGNEMVRYFSIEFDAVGQTLTALDDQQLVTDPNGNVTLIVGFGGTPPPTVTTANYYTYLDLTKFTGYTGFTALLIRDLLPNNNFECSTFNVPSYTMEYNPPGGFMGPYVPTVDFPTASQIPALPVPPIRSDSCFAVPPPPVACSVPRTPV